MSEPAFQLEVCVTHWTILAAQRREPAALFGFKPCAEEGPHEVVIFGGFIDPVSGFPEQGDDENG